MFLKTCAMDGAIFFFFFEMKEGCKVSRVKSIAWLLTNAKKGTTTLIFYIFKYGAE